MKKALLVIDMQNICVGENHSTFFKYDNSVLLGNVNAVIAEYEPENVYYILNIMKDNLISKLAPFKAFDGSDAIELVSGLSIVSNNMYKKYKGDAFSNCTLTQAIKNSGISEIEIVGVDGGGCVGRSALGAIKEGFKVKLNTNAIGTMFIKRADKINQKLKSQGAVFV